MFAIVSFDFVGNFYSTKRYIFKTDVKNLVCGDVVVVEGKKPGETVLAIFVGYKPYDKGPERKSLLKKAHKNTLKSLMKKRVETFKDIKIPKIYCHFYRTQFSGNRELNDFEIKQKIIRNLCVSPIRSFNSTENGITERHFFGSMRISVRNNEIVSLVRVSNKRKWIRPFVLEEIAEEYLDQVFEKEEVGV